METTDDKKILKITPVPYKNYLDLPKLKLIISNAKAI